MAQDAMAEAVQLGEANLNAIELVRRHCRHARIEFTSGNSWAGTQLGLPLGPVQVRCQHAPAPAYSGHRALELAVDFYRANCVDCPHRDGTGELPNLKTEVATRDAEDERRRQEAQRREEDRAARYARRRQRRRAMVSSEGYVVRDLADVLDRLDADRPRERQPTDADMAAGRELIESARASAVLFSGPLVETLLEMAVDTAEPAAFMAIAELVRAGRCMPRAAVDTALAVLSANRVPEAGDVLASFADELCSDDLPPVLDRLIQLAAGLDLIRTEVPPAPDGLLAAARVDWGQVSGHIRDRLGSDNDRVRADAATAAGCLLVADATRVVELGPALVASVRGPDQGYAGEPHPAGVAARAMAEAWRQEPQTTVTIIESGSAGVSDDVRAELVRVVWFLKRWREPLDLSTEATDAAVAFCARRITGDWGEQAANRAADDIAMFAEELPDRVVPHVHVLLGNLLAPAAHPASSPLLSPPATGSDQLVAHLEQQSLRIQRAARRRKVAECMGRLVRHAPAVVLPVVLDLFAANSGDEAQDRTVRVAMLKALREAASVPLLRDVLPVLYSALLSRDAVVRANAIDLWERCTAVAGDAMPDDLMDLVEPLLADELVVVHQSMLDRLPRLNPPPRLAGRLLVIVYGWVLTYRDRNEPDVLDDALWSIRYLSWQLDDEQKTLQWFRFVLAHIPLLRASDRERMLTATWPNELRSDPAWSRAALGTLADPEVSTLVGPRDDPLLAALLDRPLPMATVPLEEILAVTNLHLPDRPWRALEPVELLQAVGRHTDARTLARRVAAGVRPGVEGSPGRALADLIAAATDLDALFDSATSVEPAEFDAALRAVTEAVASFTALRLPTTASDSNVTDMLAAITARSAAVQALLTTISADPTSAADALGRAAQQVEDAAGKRHASAAQRRDAAAAWQVAGMLARYDAAARAADPDAPRLLEAAHRQAQVLGDRRAAEPHVPVPEALRQFCTATCELTSTASLPAAFSAAARVSLPIPLVRLPERPWPVRPPEPEMGEDEPLAVCVASYQDTPITDVFVVRPNEVYPIEMTVRLRAWPAWATHCHVEPVTRLSRTALTVPSFTFTRADICEQDTGLLVTGTDHLHCAVNQPIQSPAFDCPLVVRFTDNKDREQRVQAAGYRRLRVRPFDPSRDQFTEHEQTDQRLLGMYDRLHDAAFDTEDVRAFCRLFTACVTAAQSIMFDKVFRRGTRVTEKMFHDALEQRLRTDSALGGRLTRRDPVAGGFDDLLHDDVIAELKVERTKAITIEDCAKYLGQPTQYGIGRGSQLSILVVLDHSRKQAPPGVIENYVGWLKPALHGLDAPQYPSLVGVLIINTNLPVPSTWSRRAIATVTT